MNRCQLNSQQLEGYQRMFAEARARLPFCAIYLDENYSRVEFQTKALLEIQSTCETGKKLAIVLPPKHGKSRLIVEAISWLIGKDPTKTITLAGDFEYGGKDISVIRTSQTVRERLSGSSRFGVLFSARLHDKERKAVRWRTTAGGGLNVIKVGHQASPADHLFVDDPIPTFGSGQLASNRETVWNWFRSICVTGLKPGGSVVVVGSRTNWDDVFGRIERSGEEWKIYKRKAIE